MQGDTSVMVYDYEYWDPDKGAMLRSHVPATLEAIKSGLGIPLVSTGRWVPLSQIDGLGRVHSTHQKTTT